MTDQKKVPQQTSENAAIYQNDSNKIKRLTDLIEDNKPYQDDKEGTVPRSPRAPNLTYEEVVKAAEELEKADIEVTTTSLYEHLKRGSYSTLTKMMSRWRNAKHQREINLAKHAVNHNEVMVLAQEIVEKAFMGNMKQVNAERESIIRITQSEIDKLDGELKELGRKLDERDAAIATLSAQLSEEREKVKELSDKILAAVTDKITFQKDAERLEVELKFTRQNLQEARSRLKTYEKQYDNSKKEGVKEGSGS